MQLMCDQDRSAIFMIFFAYVNKYIEFRIGTRLVSPLMFVSMHLFPTFA